jgi:replicative DNA helicase
VFKVAARHGVPVLHFDNGEMSEEELKLRMLASVSKIPMFLIESGQWRTAKWKNMSQEEVVKSVRDAYAKIKKAQCFYFNVAGLSLEEMKATLKRFYYSKVGRGNPLIFSFDYIKMDYGNNSDSWVQIGKMVNEFKALIQKEIIDEERRPCVSMLTSVQANRSAIIGNKRAES